MSSVDDTPPTRRAAVLHGAVRLCDTDGRPLPLRTAHIAVTARAGIARVVIEQHFRNPRDLRARATYNFAVPSGAKVAAYSFRVGERRLSGEIERRAALEGESLADEIVPHRFAQEIGGVPAGAEVAVELALDVHLHYSAGRWELRVPALAASPFGAAELVDGVSIPQSIEGSHERGARLTLSLAIGDAAKDAESPTHELCVRPSASGVEVSLTDEASHPGRELVVRWPAAKAGIDVQLDVARPVEGSPHADVAFAAVALVPPLKATPETCFPRDVAILLDAGDAMRGESLEIARSAIAAIVDSLGESDQLEVYALGEVPRTFGTAPVHATPDARASAIAWVTALAPATRPDGDRGPARADVRAALGETLRPLRPNAVRQIMLVSTGSGFELDALATLFARLPEACRVHVVTVGPALDVAVEADGRPLIAVIGEASARAGRGAFVAIRSKEDVAEATREIVAKTAAPLLTAIALRGAGVLEAAPQRPVDLTLGAPVIVGARLKPEGGEVIVVARSPSGRWERKLDVRTAAAGASGPHVPLFFARELASDLEVRLLAAEDPAAFEASLERLGLDHQIATRATAWVAVSEKRSALPGGTVRKERIPQELPRTHEVEDEVHDPSAPLDEKTRVTAVVNVPSLSAELRPVGTDCLIAIYSKEPTLLGKRFALDANPMRIGRGSENNLVLEGDSVSRRHARLEYRDDRWWCLDEGSTNGTYVNDRPVAYEIPLSTGARIKVGSTIFKYLTGHDVEAQYHEEIYRLTIIDGLTEAHVKRYLLESLEKEILRSRRRARDLAVLMFDIDHFKKINDAHGHLAGDHVLKELARVVLQSVRADDVFGRYGGEEFALVLPETSLAAAKVVAETLREKIATASFVFQGTTIPTTISVGAACLVESDTTAVDLIKRADEKLYEAKRGGRNRVMA